MNPTPLHVRLRDLTARDGGFTLIEVLAVMVIVGLLAAIAIPQIGKFRERAYVASLKSDARMLVNEAEGVYADTREYPATTPAVDLSPHNTVAWGVPTENGVNFVITNVKANKSLTVTNNKLSGVTDGGVAAGEPDEGENTGPLSGTHTVSPNPTPANSVFVVTVNLTPTDVVVEKTEMFIDDYDLGPIWVDVTGMVTWSNGQAMIPGETGPAGHTETTSFRFTTSYGVYTMPVSVTAI